MCSFAAAGLAFTAIRTVSSFIGQRNEGKAQQDAANYQAQIAENNRITALRLAEDARLRGEADEARHVQAVNRLKGRQRAVLASNGVLVDQGSALQITGDTAELGKLDQLTIRQNAAREALGFEADAANFGAQQQVLISQGENARLTSSRRSLSTLLTGVGSIASKWYGFNKAGVNVFGA